MTPAEFYVLRMNRTRVAQTNAKSSGSGRKGKTSAFHAALNERQMATFFKGPLFTQSSTGLSHLDMINATPPSPDEIAKNQMDLIKSSMVVDPAVQQFIQMNKNLFQQQGLYSMYLSSVNRSVGEAMEEIERVLNKTSFIVKGDAPSVNTQPSPFHGLLTSNGGNVSFAQNVQTYQQLDAALTDVLNIFTTIDNGSMVQIPNLKTCLSRLQSASTSLQADLKAYSQGKPVQGGDYINSGHLWSAYAQLKGRFLELAFKEWLGNAPQQIQVLDTSKLRIQGQVIKSGADLGLINMQANMPSIGISCTVDGQPKTFNTILEFFEYVGKYQNTKTISLESEDQWQNIMQHMTGINVKSGYGQSIVNKDTVGNAVSIEELSNDSYRILRLFNEWYGYHHYIYAVKPEVYNAYFDLGITHLLINILGGKHNGLVGTRYGLMTLADYIEQEWRDRHAYFHARGNVSIASVSAKYQLIFSGKSKY